jgi:hypothetical protein
MITSLAGEAPFEALLQRSRAKANDERIRLGWAPF